MTGPEEVATFTRFWADSGWSVTETNLAIGGARTLVLSKGTESGFAWVFPTRPPDRASLFVTLITQPRTEVRQ